MLPQAGAAVASLGIGWFAGALGGLAIGAGVYGAIFLVTRRLVPADHLRGLELIRRGKYHEAITAHQASYRFFHNRIWLDKHRAILLLSPTPESYREMALVNVAHCYSQRGDYPKAKAYYKRALKEFPGCEVAESALKALRAAKDAGLEPERFDVEAADAEIDIQLRGR